MIPEATVALEVPDEEVENEEVVTPETVDDDTKPVDTDKSGKKDKWDPDRQKLDQNIADTRKLGKSLETLNETVSSMSGDIVEKVKGILADSAKPDGKPIDEDTFAKIASEIEGMDNDDIVEPSVKAAFKSLVAIAKESRATNANLKKQLDDTAANEKTRTERETATQAQLAANKALNSRCAKMEKRYAGGEKYLTQDALRLAQESVNKAHGVAEGEPDYIPVKSEALEAVDDAFYEVHKKYQQDKKKPKTDPFDLDSLAGGTVVDEEKQRMTQKDWVAKKLKES
jgi:hypothetical protein